MEIASNTEHYLKMVGGTIAFRDRRVPAQVSSGSGPAQLDRSVTRDYSMRGILGIATGSLWSASWLSS
jgi:hypothetical protein